MLDNLECPVLRASVQNFETVTAQKLANFVTAAQLAAWLREHLREGFLELFL